MSETPSKGKCPICKSPSDAHYRPFCSRRCADVDLGRWLSGSYAIAAGEDEEPDAGTRSGPVPPSDADET